MSTSSLHHSRLATIALAAVVGSIVVGCSSAPGGTGVGVTVAPTGSATAAASGAASEAATPSQDAASVSLVANVDVGGRTIFVSCLGTAPAGVPTVVLEAGLGGPAQVWNPVFRDIAAKTRVCAYDRAGLGASGPLPSGPSTTASQVADLHAALAGAKVAGPYVLAGHSSGAWNEILYTSTYPDDVVGLVFVDPRGPAVSADWLAALPPAASSEPASVAANRDELTTFGTDPSLNPEGMDLAKSEAEATKPLKAAGRLFADRPVVVLGAAHTKDSWADLPTDLRRCSTRSGWTRRRSSPRSRRRARSRSSRTASHEVMDEAPEAVVDAVIDVLGQVGAH